MKAQAAEVIASIEDLTPDPRNARKHGQRNTGMLVSSLREVGAARSIVIDENGVILAGNATVEAANEIGLKAIKVVEADGNTIIAVRRSGLTPEQKTRLALFDNRTAELAEWDTDVLTELIGDGVDLKDMWNVDELKTLIGDIAETGAAKSEEFSERFAIVIDCENEAHQTDLLTKFTEEGIVCKAIVC